MGEGKEAHAHVIRGDVQRSPEPVERNRQVRMTQEDPLGHARAPARVHDDGHVIRLRRYGLYKTRRNQRVTTIRHTRPVSQRAFINTRTLQTRSGTKLENESEI